MWYLSERVKSGRNKSCVYVLQNKLPFGKEIFLSFSTTKNMHGRKDCWAKDVISSQNVPSSSELLYLKCIPFLCSLSIRKMRQF